MTLEGLLISCIGLRGLEVLGVFEIETDPPRSFLGVTARPEGVVAADRPDEAGAE